MAERARKKKRGSVGAEIFEQIEKIVADQKVSRSAAFRRLGEKTGRQPGTVAANYYRVARKRGAKVRKRAGRRGAAGAGQTAIGRALAALEQAAALLRQHAAEVVALRQENARLGQIRKLVGRK